jgi:LmbE family N-acetylglucosaminyl deacetylase
MSLLFASDKLFLSLFSGATAIGIVFYLATRNWCMVKHYLGWTGSGVLTWAMASFFVRIINHLHITNFSSTLAPYSLIHSSHDLILGIIYGVLGLFTNFGANPGFDASTLRNLPHITIERLGSFGQQGYVVNLLILCLGVYTLLRLLLNSLSRKKVKEIKVLDSPTKLSIFLIWSSFAAAGSFVLTDHYYFVDARYLTITMFTIFICAATYFRKKLFSRRFFYISNWVLVLTIGLSMYGAYQIYNSQNIALNDINTRNHTVVEILKARNFDTLVGDYWRVIPIRQESKKHLSVTPLSDCTTTRDMLSSKLWQPDLTKNNFAYLLSLDKSLTDFPSCSLEQVIAKYGLPYKSNVVSGSRAHPKELLLFYYRETSTNFNAVDKNSSATVTPLALDSIDNEYCTVPTIIQIIAHQDDDLLFMNPDLLHDIKDGNCVRTVYLTAGDSGADSHYWLGRESGAEDAYSSMLGVDSVWEERLIRLKSGQLVTIASPRSNAKISLIFMRLPDGNVRGGGFNSQHFSSITKLQSGIINSLKTTDNESSYTLDELQKALVSLLIHYGPSSIRTQSSHEVVSPNPDHSDHITASKLAKKAYANYELLEYQNTTMIPFTSYVGYPIKDREKNVFGVDLVEKLKAFKAYAKNDNAVCTPVQSCWQKSNYSLFMSRQYHADD